MKPLLSDYIFSDVLRYEGHRFIYSGKEGEEPVSIGGFLGAAELCVRLINTDEVARRGIAISVVILRDKSHPRYMELYHRWRAQLSAPKPYKQFQGFVRAVMMQEQ